MTEGPTPPAAEGPPAEPPNQPPDDETLFTIRVRRSTMYVAAALAVGFLAGFWLSQLLDEDIIVPPTQQLQVGTGAVAATPPPTNIKVSIDGRPFKGPKDAPVTVVEFTDYQCPFCKRHFDDTLSEILSTYKDDVRYVVRNFPIPEIHPFATKAAEAAECALKQGRFWEYHDTLFEHQDQLAESDLKAHAKTVGLDAGTFEDCLEGGDTSKLVATDVSEGKGYGVTSTPTFIINGTLYKGAANLVAFKSRIDQALAAKD